MTDEPLPHVFNASTSEAKKRAQTLYHLSALSGTAYFIAVLLGGLIGGMVGRVLLSGWTTPFADVGVLLAAAVVAGAVLLPTVLLYASARRARRWAEEDDARRRALHADREAERKRQLADAKASGAYVGWES